MKTEDFLAHRGASASVFKILAEHYHLPDQMLSQNVDELLRCIETACPEAVQHVVAMKASLGQNEELERLAVDFARLFVGPFSLLAPPYGSVYLDGENQLLGNSTVDVGRRYLEAGLDLAADFRDAPDHIAAELEFMYFLILKETEALHDRSFQRLEDFLQKQFSFLENHLAAWVPEFTKRVEENAMTEFFKDLAAATRIFVLRNQETLMSAITSGEMFQVFSYTARWGSS